MAAADKSRSPKVAHMSVLVKALKWPPNQLFPGAWIENFEECFVKFISTITALRR